VNIHSSLVAELKQKKYRDQYVASQINIGLPFQVRALRQQRNWTQGQLASKTGMAQPRISEIETAGTRHLNLETLLRLASAFDVALDVRFVPFSELVDRSDAFDPDSFAVPSFSTELKQLALQKPQERAAVSVSSFNYGLTGGFVPGEAETSLLMDQTVISTFPGSVLQKFVLSSPKYVVADLAPAKESAA
jgi:transcriptional regulator with XRE-family HTH domain